MDSSTPSLPPDIIFETLSRISSLKELDACRMVCKDWNQQLHDPSFMPTYCKNTHNLYGYYVQNQRSSKYVQKFISLEPSQFDEDHASIKVDNKFWGDGAKIEASSKQGILCVVRWKSRSRSCRYYICKPSTGQWQPLPNPKLRFWTLKVALVVLHSNPLRFKIVRISQDYGSKSMKYSLDCSYAYCCEIFDSETWAWRRLDDIFLPYGVFFDHKTQSVHASGLIYLLTTDDHVVAFYHEDESYVRFPLPPLKISNSSSHQLIEYEGKLGLVCKSTKGETIQLWVVDDTKSHRWSLIKEVELDSSLEGDHAIPQGFYNRNIALLNACHKMVFYKLQDSTSVKEIELGIGIRSAEQIFPFRSDLEPINLRSE